MELFKELKVHLNWIGVWRSDCSARAKELSVLKKCVVYITLISSFLSTGWFRLFSAQTVRETTESSFFALSALGLVAWYSVLLWQHQQYATILDELDVKMKQSG